MTTTYPYQTGTAYTDPSNGPGKWQEEIMAPVTGAADTVTENMYGFVDSQGRVAVAYVSAARTATPTAYPLYTRGATGVVATVVVTAAGVTPSVVFTIEAYDPASATWTALLTSAAITGTGTTKLSVALGIAEVTNLAVSKILPDTIRIVPTHGNATTITYSVGLDWMTQYA